MTDWAGKLVAGTGHRPDKLGGYDSPYMTRARGIARSWLAHNLPRGVISGMALGWDQALAWAAVDTGIPFLAAVPFEGQEMKWPLRARDNYRTLISQAAKLVVVCPGGYAPEKMQIRNQYMVDKADVMLALWNGTPGGTANCIRYAESKQKPVVNLWPVWDQ